MFKKWLFCYCLLFTTVLHSYSQEKKAKNVVLMIGDGMGTAQIFAGLTANKGKLHLERFPYSGFHKSQSSDGYVTDSGAGATAFSIGKKTYNGAIGVDATRVAHTTILELAAQQKKATGMVVSCSVTHATPASFIAHQPARNMMEEIAADFLNTNIDVFIGGGKKYFNNRKDNRNLLDSLRKRNYQVMDTLPDILKVTKGKLAGFIADGEPPRVTEGRNDQLLQSTKVALNILQQNKNGFFLMVEGSQIDWGGHANDIAYVTSEMIDFDNTIGAVLDFAEKDGNTLVIITGDHETGGLTVTGGNMNEGTVEAKFTTGGHTAVMIPVFAYGPGAEHFGGIYENTAIFDKILHSFNLNTKNLK